MQNRNSSCVILTSLSHYHFQARCITNQLSLQILVVTLYFFFFIFLFRPSSLNSRYDISQTTSQHQGRYANMTISNSNKTISNNNTENRIAGSSGRPELASAISLRTLYSFRPHVSATPQNSSRLSYTFAGNKSLFSAAQILQGQLGINGARLNFFFHTKYSL